MSYIRKKAIAGLQQGDTFSVSRTFSEEDVTCFATLSRDYNPVHFDERFTRAKKFSGRICHGLLVAGLLTEIGGQLGWLASRMQFAFKKPVYIGDTIECTFTITQLDQTGRAEAKAIYTNQHDMIVLEADLAGIVPGDKERKVMAAMIAEDDPSNTAGC
jgi:3-hydroxybutyryl-CoA dehydratase